jgi:putative PIN family toxin of toxin-antitoxin system
MRVMLDTNILISTFVFDSKLMKGIIERIATKYSLVLCSYVIDELHDVVNSKFSNKTNNLEKFLLELPFEFIYTPQTIPKHDIFEIRDEDDEKVLFSAIAILADVDVLITGDKDFQDVDIERPEILTPAEFLDKY